MSTRGLLSEKVKLVKIKDHSAAATSAVTSDAIDMTGYRGCLVITSFGTAAADNTMKLQQSSDDGSADDYSDLEGTSVASGTSDEDVWLDIYNPGKRYIKAVVARGTSSTLESMWALLYDPYTLPVDNTTSGTITGEGHVNPAEGTA
jgi:hypothetical protein